MEWPLLACTTYAKHRNTCAPEKRDLNRSELSVAPPRTARRRASVRRRRAARPRCARRARGSRASPSAALRSPASTPRFFVFSEHFESIFLRGYRRRLKSPLVALGPLGVRKKSDKFHGISFGSTSLTCAHIPGIRRGSAKVARLSRVRSQNTAVDRPRHSNEALSIVTYSSLPAL